VSRPGVWRCGSILACVPGDRRGPKYNPAATKYVFGPGGGTSHMRGPHSPCGGFWADSTLFLSFPNEALNGLNESKV
jgi:hypothetical protein